MNAAPRRSVVVVSAFDAPFIDDDVAILAGSYQVRRLSGNGPAALWRAVRSASSADVVFCWFLSVYATAAILAGALFGRPSVLVIGGVDVARDARLGYGLWLSRWKSFFARRAMRRADRVLVVAERLRGEAVRLAGYPGGNIRYLPTGYDPSYWTPDAPGGRSVLTVASADNRTRLKIKGIDVLVGAARLLPDIPFTVVGVDAALVPALGAPPNVSFVPPVERPALLPYYRRAKVYCQPSRREGLPNALCEAMLCGCVPAVSDAGDSRIAVGDTGFVAGLGDPGGLASAINDALGSPAGAGTRARDRIIRLFPAERRREGLLAIMNELTRD